MVTSNNHLNTHLLMVHCLEVNGTDWPSYSNFRLERSLGYGLLL